MKFDWAKAAPVIFSGLAILGVGATAYFAAKCHEEALPEIVKIKKEKEEANEPVKKVDLLKATWKHYIPVMVSAGATVTCIILSNAISAKQLAVMTATASAAVAQKNKIIAKAKEVVGEDKWSEVEKAVAEDEVKEKMKSSEAKDGEVIFYDTFTNYSFYATKSKVEEAIYRINRILALEGRANVADFYELIGTDSPWYAAEYGWSVNKGLEEGRYVWIDIELETIKDDCNSSNVYYRIHYIIEPTTDYELEGYKEEDTSAVERAYQEQYGAIAC